MLDYYFLLFTALPRFRPYHNIFKGSKRIVCSFKAFRGGGGGCLHPTLGAFPIISPWTHSTIGEMLRNLREEVNWSPQSICSQCVSSRAFPWSGVSKGVPFTVCKKTYIAKLWMTLVRVQTTGMLKKGMLSRTTCSSPTKMMQARCPGYSPRSVGVYFAVCHPHIHPAASPAGPTRGLL